MPVKALPDRFLRQAGREVEKARAAAASHWAGSAAGPSLFWPRLRKAFFEGAGASV